ncbi:MAG: hypothetical protein V1916_00825 [Patescibacteria group bacterium]
MKMKLLVILALIAVACFAVSIKISSAESAVSVAATKVQVNQLGAISVSGTVTCAGALPAVVAHYGYEPANLTIVTPIEWDAYQPAGKNKIVHAEFGSDYLKACYNTNPNVGIRACGTASDPCPWITSHYGSTATPAFVFAPNGKFSPGAVQVDVFAGANECVGYVLIDGVWQDFQISDVCVITSSTVKAQKVR